jgi:hypothetical protein
MTLDHALECLRAREAEAGPLAFGAEVNAARYVGGARETVVAEVRVSGGARSA